MSVDPLAESFTSWSPYVYSYNNPIRFIDPDGAAPSIANGPGDPVGPALTVAKAVGAAWQGLNNLGLRIASPLYPKSGRANAIRNASMNNASPVYVSQGLTDDEVLKNYRMEYRLGDGYIAVAKKGILQEAGQVASDVLDVVGVYGGGGGPVLAAKTPGSIIPSIAKAFENFQCMECADAVVTALKKEGIGGSVIEYRTLNASGNPSAYNIVSLTKESAGSLDAISTSGVHRAVLVDGKVYDNIHPNGINYDDWVKDFEHLAPKYKVDTIKDF